MISVAMIISNIPLGDVEKNNEASGVQFLRIGFPKIPHGLSPLSSASLYLKTHTSIPRRRHNDGNCYASLENSYRVLCPDDPAGLNGPEKHRAMSDAAVAGYVLLALIGKGLYPEEVPE